MNLSVNLNKVALLRNSRGARNPCPKLAAACVLDAGAQGLTLHWREDNRHTRREDVIALRALALERGAEFNLEGDLREELLALALEIAPDQVTLVPVTPGEVTSDHGWRLPAEVELLRAPITRLKARGIRISIFVDPNPETVAHAAETGADRIEIYTEPYASAAAAGHPKAALDALCRTAERAASLGLGINAGHDLDLNNLPALARSLPLLQEVSIGHALLSDALYLGLGETVRRYLAACAGEEVEAPHTH